MKIDFKKILHDTSILFVICIISGFVLGIAYQITSPITAARKAQEKAETYSSFFEEGASFADADIENQADILAAAGYGTATISDCMIATNDSGEILGYALSVITPGKVAEITVAVCISSDGTVLGIEILTSSETAGLGSKANDDSFKSQFSDKNVSAFVTVKSSASSDEEIEAISGATVTTDAVVLAANAAITFANSLK